MITTFAATAAVIFALNPTESLKVSVIFIAILMLYSNLTRLPAITIFSFTVFFGYALSYYNAVFLPLSPFPFFSSV